MRQAQLAPLDQATPAAPAIPARVDRGAVRAAYRADEATCVAQRLMQAASAQAVHHTASDIAARLVRGARGRKASGLDVFLQTYGLGTDEGIALMCLAEALLRVPDKGTADALIHDKVGRIDWAGHLGASGSTFVNATTFSLMLTGKVLDQRRGEDKGIAAALGRAVGRLGEPVIRAATLQAMKILGGQFVYGRTIGEAMARATPETAQGLSHSFDMLGEAAMTADDAETYRRAYVDAIDQVATKATGGVARAPGISVKLSALYPRYDYLHATAAAAALLPIVRDLALRARAADVHLTIDAEEADRLELSMDIIEALIADDTLFEGGWTGFGLALQAYQKRAVPLADWVIALARRHRRQIMVRLVKGAYWDSEIKAAQVDGYHEYPVFTQKVATDVSYLATAARLLAAPDAVYPAFATHNAYTIGAIKALAGTSRFEFQRLHGMGEEIYDELATLERADGAAQTPVRIYAPVGNHTALLAYLVRRLLENGANSSFVNRMANANVPVAGLVGDPVAELAALDPVQNPAIPLPSALYPGRVNSAGIDLSDPLVRVPLLARLTALETRRWSAAPTATIGEGKLRTACAPHDRLQIVGTVRETSAAEVDAAISRARAAFPAWDALGGAARATLIDRAADLYEDHRDELLSLCQREAGKTLNDAVLELREAVDFLRYYAHQARHLFAAPQLLAGPTGERNSVRLAGRGVFGTITPWNFPLAIFSGPVVAALAAGNCVVAKPAAQTPLIGAFAVQLMHTAGIPDDVIQCLPGGAEVGAAISRHSAIAGIAFTGSTITARAINRALAARDAPIATFIAETGGQNAMIVDSSALPEQVTRDVVASAFQSAGQRCSALRILYLQRDVADAMLTMICGAAAQLVIGDPADAATDIGPVIDEAAQTRLLAHIAVCRARGWRVHQVPLPETTACGCYVPPTIIEVESIRDLTAEQFGPILHVARFDGAALDTVIDDINAVGFGLTLGLHSRIEATHRRVENRARVGNLYINRNQIGAVVESQPFGGEGLSGTGPKAGGPHYVPRFATERAVCIDTTAAGGNVTLMANAPH